MEQDYRKLTAQMLEQIQSEALLIRIYKFVMRLLRNENAELERKGA